MSETFDEVVEASWTRFEERLAGRVRALRGESLEIEPAEPTEDNVPFLMIDGNDEGLVAELIGFSEELDQVAIEALGWQSPGEPEESPFWCVALSSDEAEVLAGMVSGTLRYVFGVADPAFLAGEPNGTLEPSASRDAEEDAESDHDPVFGFPSNAEELVGMVEQALGASYGPDVVRDDDGDFPINSGVVPIWVRGQEDAPMVRIFSYVVCSVRNIRQARIEVGVLNRRTPLLKFTLADGVITATYELPATPFVGSQLLHTIDLVSEVLNGIAADTAARVGGKLWFDGMDTASPSDREGSA